MKKGKTSYYVFLSYSSKDKHDAGTIKEKLEEYGIRTFLAHDDITPSILFKKNIIREIRNCKLFIPIISKSFKMSAWTDQESGIAHYLRRNILPICLDGSLPYGFLADYQAKQLKSNDFFELCNDIAMQIFGTTRNTAMKKKIKRRIIDIFIESASWRGAERNMENLLKHRSFTKEQINEIIEGIIDNAQINDAADNFERIHKLAKQYRTAITADNMTKLNERMGKVSLKKDWLLIDK